MTIRVQCEHCDAAYGLKDEHAGKRIKCPKCGEPVRVPEATAPPSAPTLEATPEDDGGFVELDEAPAGSASRITPVAVVAAAMAGLIGAAIWAFVAHRTGYEFLWIAWGVGGAVGLASIAFGGRGASMGALAGGLALLAVVGGRVAATRVVLARELDIVRRTELSERDYRADLRTAEAFAELSDERSDEVLREFMVEHEYTGSVDARTISGDEVDAFRSELVPYLESLHPDPPPFETWQEDLFVEIEANAMSELGSVGAVLKNTTPMGAAFTVLAIGTAFGLCFRRGKTIATDRKRRKTMRRASQRF